MCRRLLASLEKSITFFELVMPGIIGEFRDFDVGGGEGRGVNGGGGGGDGGEGKHAICGDLMYDAITLLGEQSMQESVATNLKPS